MGEMRELEFRDGKRLVPAHLAEMMATLPTHTLSFEQAVEKANWKLASDFANHAGDRVVQSHLRIGGR